MPDKVKISVRSLVEYVYRSGSIDSRFRTSTTLHEGTKAHQKIQKTYNEKDEKEFYVSAEIPYEGLVFTIDGRCDGLLFSEDMVTVDEIKSTSGDLSNISADTYPVHWAQAKCYAYMYAKDHEINEIYVQLTYVQVDTEEKKQFIQSFSREELTSFVMETVKGYFPYASFRIEHQLGRDNSIKELPFPFDAYREGQRKLAGAVYKTISDEKNLFARAPTGIGKTVSTTFPSIKAIGEGHIQRIFYLTAKTITRESAEEAFSLMQEKGLCMNAVTITAKDKVCFKEKTICQKGYCEFADGYYDRINGAVLDILRNEKLIDRKTIEKYAKKHTVCPFEFSLDVAYAADAIICDYNYIFDPRISLKRFFEEQKKQTILLIDEAHNLVDRAREMFSADLFKSHFLQIKREYKNDNSQISDSAKAVNDSLLALKKQCNEQKNLILQEIPEQLVELLEVFSSHAEKELVNQRDGESQQLLLDTYFLAQGIIRISQYYDERYLTYVEYEKSEVRIKLFCLDPSALLQKMGKNYRSKIYFSATLSPLDYYRDMLGADDEDYSMSVPSPFAKENAEVFIQPLSTRYRDRERTKEPIAKMIGQLAGERPGNYLVFFPSYQYMINVYEQFMEQGIDIPTIVQDRGMSEEEREAFLSSFKAESEQKLIGFAVLGGIFSEGVDLKGDRLNGVVVIGVGLPQFGLERNIIKDYFNSVGKKGYDYAYVFPGMNKVLQAGGRLIRSENDRGVIVLVDDRFLHRNYLSLLPEEWKDYTVI
ncbi:ATP-dependent DNA helicase [Pseudalkalibacillus caeni]|uniref:ATP-dependent DNA helicase n=1 Tax=Exobacillus caeni TaxID=2574798 RepID=A0A5R9F5D7_9BACL|nr:ATP-dependent DNA helicase [Pseudalkalibacillus caeni]TLS36033.1 ATP-dependent DNA helicase [Pseudalkalibacillus caeni]